MSVCPDEDVLAAFGEGRLPAGERARIEDHLDGCATCMALVASAVRGGPEPGGDGDALDPGEAELSPRYRLLRRIGHGGFANVFVAHDRALDREVAVKVLRGDRDGVDVRRRIVREAQVLARLCHPNIVEVFDVARGPRGETLVVMALVRGQTLAAWLRTGRRWPEIRAVFVAIGRALAAAHAAGIVHRDVKPSNVMVADDGRAMVLDFGLARGVGEPAPAVATDDTQVLALPVGERLTASGMVLGTPMYMAPEQHDGRCDARSDQYAYAFALFEAAFGCPPFAGADWRELVAAKRAGAPVVGVRRSGVPARLHVVLARALRVEPDARWPDMDALVDALHATARPRVVVGIAGASAAGLLGASLWPRDVDDRCAEIPAVLDVDARARVAAALADGGWDAAGDDVLGELDRRSSELAELRRESCRAAGDLAAREFDRRTACFDRRAVELRTVIGLLGGSGDLDASVAATRALAQPRACLVIASDDAPLADAAVGARVEAVRSELARIDVLAHAARYDEAELASRAVGEAAEAIGQPRLLVRALLQRGILESTMGDRAAPATLERAEHLAADTGAFREAADAASMLAYLAALDVDLDRADHWARAARAALVRAGDDPDTEIAVLNRLGQLRVARGELGEAREDFVRALALSEAAFGPDDPRLMSSVANVASLARELGDPAGALALQERAIALARRGLRPGHPELGQILGDSAITLAALGQHARAHDRFVEALAIQRAALGDGHPLVAALEGNLGISAGELGDTAAAIEHLRRAVAINEAALGPGHPASIDTRASLAEQLLADDPRAAARVLAPAAAAAPNVLAQGDPLALRIEALRVRLATTPAPG